MRQYKDHDVCNPLKELKYPLDYYFPVDWFEWDEQRKKDWIRKRDDHRCQLSGKTSHVVHEIRPKGMGHKESRLVPYNMITIHQMFHQKIHNGDLEIIKFDPLNLESGLKIETEINHALHFYSRPTSQAWIDQYVER